MYLVLIPKQGFNTQIGLKKEKFLGVNHHTAQQLPLKK